METIIIVLFTGKINKPDLSKKFLNKYDGINEKIRIVFKEIINTNNYENEKVNALNEYYPKYTNIYFETILN